MGVDRLFFFSTLFQLGTILFIFLQMSLLVLLDNSKMTTAKMMNVKNVDF
jgi:hypothetical protein